MNPDWIITGMPYGTGVRLIASKDLKPGGHVKVVEDVKEIQIGRLRMPSFTPSHTEITALARNVVIVDGPDYPTALRMLLAQWSVPDAPQPVREILTGGPPDSTPRHADVYYPATPAMEAMRALEDAMAPMSDEVRALIQGVLDEEP